MEREIKILKQCINLVKDIDFSEFKGIEAEFIEIPLDLDGVICLLLYSAIKDEIVSIQYPTYSSIKINE